MPHRGARHRAAFWDGFAGMAGIANVIPGALSAVSSAAGKALLKPIPDSQGECCVDAWGESPRRGKWTETFILRLPGWRAGVVEPASLPHRMCGDACRLGCLPHAHFHPSFGSSAEAELQPSEVQHGQLRVGTYEPNRIGWGDVALPSLQGSWMTEVDLSFYERVTTSTRWRLFLRSAQLFCHLIVGSFPHS